MPQSHNLLHNPPKNVLDPVKPCCCYKALKDYFNKKACRLYILQAFLICSVCGPDGTRTRDLRRDRAAF